MNNLVSCWKQWIMVSHHMEDYDWFGPSQMLLQAKTIYAKYPPS